MIVGCLQFLTTNEQRQTLYRISFRGFCWKFHHQIHSASQSASGPINFVIVGSNPSASRSPVVCSAIAGSGVSGIQDSSLTIVRQRAARDERRRTREMIWQKFRVSPVRRCCSRFSRSASGAAAFSAATSDEFWFSSAVIVVFGLAASERANERRTAN